MISRLRSAFSNPLVVAYTALFVVVTGGSAAYAAATIGSAEIIDGSIQSVDIKNKNVKQADLQPAEKWREVGSVGQPQFESFTHNAVLHEWQTTTVDGSHETAGFYRDPFGTVHLKGTVCAAVSGQCDTITGFSPTERGIFTLPAGYRPAARQVFPAMTNDGAIRVDVLATGEVITDINTPLWLAFDGVSFRCAPSGSNGCP